MITPFIKWVTLAAASVVAAQGAKGAAMAADGFSGETIRLDSGALVLELRGEGDGVSLASLSDTSGRQWLDKRAGACPIWKLAFSGPDGRAVEKTGTDAALSSAQRKNDEAHLVWTVDLGGAEARVAARVRLPSGSRLSYWSLSVQLPDGWNVARADFPVIPNIARAPKLKLAAPAGWGLEYDLEPGVTYQAAYPSCTAVMPFAALYDDAGGLYVGAHDDSGSHKVLAGGASEESARFAITHWTPQPATGGGELRIPGEAVIGSFEGGWYEAAQIYRDFSFKTPWGAAGTISSRKIPDWLKETDLWLMPDPEPMKNIDTCVSARDFFDVTVSLHWYRWHQIPFDTLYPEYFPALDGFAEGVKAFQARGFHVMPYINGRLCDPESSTWKSGGSEWAARKDNGEPYTEVYGSKVPLNVMCPSTAGWQAKIIGLVERLTVECGVDGVYIDQIGAAYPERCFTDSHPHAPGGGDFWVRGYRELLEGARAKLPKNRMLTTEENAECWIDQLDALLIVNTPTSKHRLIPLFPAVYSGRAISFGFQYLPASEGLDSPGFIAKMARAFLWGSQLGWVNATRLMAPEARPGAEFLRALARCRRHTHKFLQYGRFLGEVHVSGDNPIIKAEAAGSFGGTYPLEIPSVMATAWLAEDGALGVAVVNAGESEHSVKLALPLGRANLGPDEDLKMEVFAPQGPGNAASGVSVSQSFTIPARSALVLAISRRR